MEIRLKELDEKFKYDIAARPGAENFTYCFFCGTCTATCPVAEVNKEYDPRRIIRMAILGMREAVLSSDIIWMCVRCYTCFARCPQNVKFADIMEVLRRMAVEEGYVPEDRLNLIDQLDQKVQELRCHLVRYLLRPTEELAGEIRAIINGLLEKDG
ncbi:hypothetical protein DRP53_02785 [candidate division WOR-3 bacterium]|mgnify:CR=1 FL=1|uniref:4Fe-4S ferredoxin-type domain-containing protein n=1 Tax=candidate division WOR-3 bacterium TaxID=2052148 RepID=A0A660SM35_UNCW3|nr:MAG: hypothetical protein DRP53_02785 [candidate division WOR-3 bacterium]